MHGRTLFYLLALLILGTACASPQDKTSIPEAYSNRVELSAPPSAKTVESPIYVDSVKTYTHDDRLSLLVLGNFPDGCTNIGFASHTMAANAIQLQLEGWRNADQMCSQALVAFSYIYEEIPQQALRQADSLQVNGTFYPLN